jgi:hypothetical protein
MIREFWNAGKKGMGFGVADENVRGQTAGTFNKEIA